MGQRLDGGHDDGGRGIEVPYRDFLPAFFQVGPDQQEGFALEGFYLGQLAHARNLLGENPMQGGIDQMGVDRRPHQFAHRRCKVARRHFLQGIAQISRRLRLDHDLRRTRSTRPLKKSVDRLGARRHRATRHVHLPHRPDLADLHARHRAGWRKAQTFHAPTCAGLDLSPAPGLEQGSAWHALPELAIPQLGIGDHPGPTSVINFASR